MTMQGYIANLMIVAKTMFTSEQIAIIENFNKPLIVWADPGTGKTSTIVAGLFTAIDMHKIHPKNITALSFTRVATHELKSKFEVVAKRMRLPVPEVEFRTIHSLSLKIITDNYSLLGMTDKPKVVNSNFKSQVELVEAISKDYSLSLDGYEINNISKAISSLNSSLIFDEQSVLNRSVFKKLKTSYENFTYIRYKIHLSNIRRNIVPRGDTCLYALEVLAKNPSLSYKYKDEIKLLVVDESQDMSLLQLYLMNLITDNLIIIGDLKQQIYAFNGACPDVVKRYSELYPTHLKLPLTQSFRCGQEIVDFATKIIIPNKIGGEDFKGVPNRNSIVEIKKSLNYTKVLHDLNKRYIENNNVLPVEIIFASRNNITLIPIIDALYELKLPARIIDYVSVAQLPVINDLVKLVELALCPHVIDNGLILNKIIPEFRLNKTYDNNLMKIARKDGVSLLQVNYKFREDALCSKLMSDLLEVSEENLKGASTSTLFNIIWRSYCSLYLDYHKRYLEQSPTYYTGLVSSIIQKNKFRDFLYRENDKQEYFERCDRMGNGVRCFTFHASKGMEADWVYLFDVDDFIIPNGKYLDQQIKDNCELEAAIALRNERNLLYVACTRARSELYLSYNEKLSDLITGETSYSYLDKIYETSKTEFDEIPKFLEFTKL